MNYDRAQMKRHCREAIRSARPRVWRVTVLYLILCTMVSASVSGLIPTPMSGMAVQWTVSGTGVTADLVRTAGLSALLGAVSSLVVSLITSLLQYGYCGYALRAYRGEGTYGDLLSAFRAVPRCLGAAVLSGLFVGLWSALIAVAAFGVCFLAAMVLGESVFTALVMIAVMAAAAVAIVVISYRYCLPPYFAVTGRAGTAMEAVKASKEAMKGNTGRRLVLDLSFLGWELLRFAIMATALTAGVIYAFISPPELLDDLRRLAMFAETADPQLWAEVAANVLMPLSGKVVLFNALATLITFPISLWLVGYRALASAGFYAIITDEPAPADDFAPGSEEDGLPPLTPPTPPAGQDQPGFSIYSSPSQSPAGEEEDKEDK